ncbi:MAG TPA: pyridoxamine 5'-phosphate oxidase [Gammaproteobacteria bacterium]|nr:pyridoxamine 5'-phosphate oxidase [Gammaproteobacteria bacterium]
MNKSVDLYQEAISRFQELLQQAGQTGLAEPAAMSVATVSVDGRPEVRTVLLKEVDERGFVFYTNTLSRKGQSLAAHPHAALCLFWQPLLTQVLVEGRTEPVAPAEADDYWATRPRASQIGAWASQQSEPLDSREELDQRFAEYEERFRGQAVPRPPHWSGYRVKPDLIEFWFSRAGRLHDRERYLHTPDGWRKVLVNP